MPTRSVIVDMTKPDPNGLQQACYEWCLAHLSMVAGVDNEKSAELLLRGYLRTIDPRTTGADGLCVTVKDWPE